MSQKQLAVFDFHEFATQVFANQQTIMERQSKIAERLQKVAERLYLVEVKSQEIFSRSHETKIYVRRGLAECKEYLKACSEGYKHIKEAAIQQLEETEDLSNSFATATVSTWG